LIPEFGGINRESDFASGEMGIGEENRERGIEIGISPLS
jgi:hypothetical protein